MGRTRGGDDRNKKNLQALLARLFQDKRTTSQVREQTLQTARQGLEASPNTLDKRAASSVSKNYTNPAIGANPPPIWEGKLTREGHLGISQMNNKDLIGIAEVKDAFQKYLPPRSEPDQAKEQERGKQWERDRGDEG